MYIDFNKAKAFLETFGESRQFLFFYIARQENAGRKLYHDVIQSLQKQRKESSRHQTVFSPSLSEVLQKASNPLHTSSKLKTVSENGKYGKLQVMDWNDIWHVSLLMLKIFSQSIFICPINLPKFCKFPSSNCSGSSVRLQDPVNSIFLNLRIKI